jgi:predicted Zn-dependent peptidase
MHTRLAFCALVAVALVLPGDRLTAQAQPSAVTVPVEYHKLDNGLRVVLSRDGSSPVVVVGVYYHIGFRIEPRDRTGFAHLFEHMMFQGSEHLGKNAFIGLVQANGGTLNGSTRFDFTNYYETVPSNTLQTVLWAEADRMRGLNITAENLKNQQDVVKSEVRVNVLNQPYGGFPWLDLPQVANENWFNAHNFYGDMASLEAATLEDVQAFFKTYYSPGNAALVIVGDIDTAQTLAWVRQYFGGIATGPTPERPDISEPRQEKEKRETRTDPLATRPALAVGYHAPRTGSPEYYALGLIDQILTQGDDSRLAQLLVRDRGYTGNVSGGVNLLGNMFNIQGPALYTIALFHDSGTPAEQIVTAMDAEITKLQNTRLSKQELDLALVKARSDLYGILDAGAGFGKMDLLASFALFDDHPERINTIEQEFRKVTPELIQKTAQEYLRPTNRTVLTINPKAGATGDPQF